MRHPGNRENVSTGWLRTDARRAGEEAHPGVGVRFLHEVLAMVPDRLGTDR